MNRIAIGRNIQKWRSFKGKKQTHFAGEIGISRVMLSRYENGRSTVSLETLERIAIILGIDVTILLEGSSIQHVK